MEGLSTGGSFSPPGARFLPASPLLATRLTTRANPPPSPPPPAVFGVRWPPPAAPPPDADAVVMRSTQRKKRLREERGSHGSRRSDYGGGLSAGIRLRIVPNIGSNAPAKVHKMSACVPSGGLPRARRAPASKRGSADASSIIPARAPQWWLSASAPQLGRSPRRKGSHRPFWSGVGETFSPALPRE